MKQEAKKEEETKRHQVCQGWTSARFEGSKGAEATATGHLSRREPSEAERGSQVGVRIRVPAPALISSDLGKLSPLTGPTSQSCHANEMVEEMPCLASDLAPRNSASSTS